MTADTPTADGAFAARQKTWRHAPRRIEYRLIGLSFLAAALIALATGRPFLPGLEKYGMRAVQAVMLLGSVTLVIVGLLALATRDPRGPLAVLFERGRRIVADGYPQRFAGEVALFSLFMASFLVFKMLIPHEAPFAWDSAFASLDRALLGGRDAWTVLQPLLGHGAVTIALDLAYLVWVPAVFVAWGAVSASRGVDRALAGQYRVATLLAWIFAGVGLAHLFASAGPIFATRFGFADAAAYDGLMAYLAAVGGGSWHLFALDAADLLWAAETGAAGEPGGISAMPSMHNLQAALFVLVGWRIDRRLGLALVAYAAAVFLGSIHLGWHYLVDAIAGVALAPLFWWIAGRIMRPAV